MIIELWSVLKMLILWTCVLQLTKKKIIHPLATKDTLSISADRSMARNVARNIKEYVRTLAELEDVTVVANILSDDFDE